MKVGAYLQNYKIPWKYCTVYRCHSVFRDITSIYCILDYWFMFTRPNLKNEKTSILSKESKSIIQHTWKYVFQKNIEWIVSKSKRVTNAFFFSSLAFQFDHSSSTMKRPRNGCFYVTEFKGSTCNFYEQN